VSHKTRGADTATDRAGECGEFHAAGRNFREFPVYGHHPVHIGSTAAISFAATAGSHRVVDQAIKIIMIELYRGRLERNSLTLSMPQFLVDDFTLGNRLVRPGGIGFRTRLCKSIQL